MPYDYEQKQSLPAKHQYVFVLPVSLQNITFFPHPYFLCVEQKLTHCIILPKKQGKKICPLADFASY